MHDPSGACWEGQTGASLLGAVRPCRRPRAYLAALSACCPSGLIAIAPAIAMASSSSTMPVALRQGSVALYVVVAVGLDLRTPLAGAASWSPAWLLGPFCMPLLMGPCRALSGTEQRFWRCWNKIGVAELVLGQSNHVYKAMHAFQAAIGAYCAILRFRVRARGPYRRGDGSSGVLAES